jgi:hypothetical protein
MPPWIFARSWDEAVVTCRAMLAKPEALDAKQDEVRRWWVRQMSITQARVARALVEEMREGVRTGPPPQDSGSLEKED